MILMPVEFPYFSVEPHRAAGTGDTHIIHCFLATHNQYFFIIKTRTGENAW